MRPVITPRRIIPFQHRPIWALLAAAVMCVRVSVKGTLKQNAPFVRNKLYWPTPSGTSRQSGGERLIGRTMSQTSVYSLTRQWAFCRKGYSWSVSVKPSGDCLPCCHPSPSFVTPLSVPEGDMHEFKEIKERYSVWKTVVSDFVGLNSI